jgi:sulfatase maturation enzyme AslB (radical SAM superfamily)
MIDNKTFCVLPFIHLAADPAGQLRPCCISSDLIRKSNAEPYNLGYDSVADIFNSPDFIEIRRKMVTGEPVTGCSECYEQEQHGDNSQRITWNDKWNNPLTNYEIEKMIARDYRSDLQIQYVDLRLGNMCNLKCRSCDTVNSSQLSKEVTEIAHKSEKILQFMPIKAVPAGWYETAQFKQNLHDVKDSIYLVYMTGGEPTLIPENIEYLQRLVDAGRANQIRVMLSTNLTNAKPEFLDILRQFNNVIVFASIDGYGDMHEYLRAPSDYAIAKKNLLAFAALPNVTVEVSPVVQAANINLITELFDDLIGIQTPNMRIFPIVLLNPKHLSIEVLPAEFKAKTRKQIVDWLSVNIVPNSEFQWRMHQALSLLQEPENPQLLEQFCEFTRIFDTHRGVSLAEVNPELAAAINYV